MTIRVLDGSEREDAAHAWAAVESRLDHVPLSGSWTWTATWLRHYGDAVEARFVVAERDGRACGVALLVRSTRRRGPVPVRQLHVGTGGEPVGHGVCVEYNDLLCVDDAARTALVQAIARLAVADRRWDELVVDGAVRTDVAEAVATALASPIAPALRVRRHAQPTFDRRPLRHHDLRLAAPEADLASALASGPRRRLRTSLRAFAARGPLELDWPSDVPDALAILDELADLHQQRWQQAGHAGAFASPRFVGFHRELIAQRLPEGGVAVVRVRCGAETVGCLYALIDGDRVLFYQSGLAASDDNRLRPGIVAHAVFMQACRERGFAVYDFLAGDHRYKRDLATGHDELTWCTVVRPRLRLRAVAQGRALRDAGRRLREQAAAARPVPSTEPRGA